MVKLVIGEKNDLVERREKKMLACTPTKVFFHLSSGYLVDA